MLEFFGLALIAHRVRHVIPGLERGEVMQVLAGGGQTARIDLLLVHEGVVEIPDLPAFRIQAIARPRFQPVHDLFHAVLAQDLQILERAGGGAVGRDDGRLQPITVDIGEEVVARLHRFVHGGEIDAPGAEGWLGGLGRNGRRAKQHTESDRDVFHCRTLHP
jgi:hypothetical protein